MKFIRRSLLCLLVALTGCALSEGGPVFASADELADNVSKVKELPESAIPYLEKNSVVLEAGTDLSIPFDMSDARVIVIGEAHSVKDSFDLKLDLFKHFNRTYGIRCVLVELDVKGVYDINRYLQSGDESFIEYYRTHWRDQGYFGLREHYTFMQNLYKYNMTLDQERRIVLLPIDSTGTWGDDVVEILRLYLPENKDAPETISDVIGELKKTDVPRYSIADFSDLYSRIEESTSLYTADFKDYLGENYDMFWYTVRKAIRTCRVQGNSAEGDRRTNLRDKAAYESVCDLMQIYPDEKFMSQYGSAHIFQKRCDIGDTRVTSWPERLKNDKKDRGGIISIYPIYCECESVIDEEDKPGVPDYIMDIFETTNEDPRIKQRFEQAAVKIGARHMLFSLVGGNSPFTKECYVVKNATGGVTTDYFQYVLLIRKSAAAQWWEL